MSSLTKGTVKVDIKRDSSGDFASDMLLKAGEPAFETDTYRLKIGDGSTLWEFLPYINSSLDSTDRVGMGTNTPTANLQITQGTSGVGTVTITSNTTCTGTGTQFLNTFKVGDSIILTAESETREITAIASNTVMTIASATDTIGSAYTLAGGEIAVFKGNQYIGFGTTSPETRLHIASALTSTPILTIENTTNDQTGSHLKFLKDKGAAGASGDVLGSIDFYGDDAGQAETQFASIHAEVDVATNGQESGEIALKVASHDGELQPGLIITGGSVEDEVDVTIGTGAASMTTIAGDLDIDGDVITTAGNISLDSGGLVGLDAHTYAAGEGVAFYAAGAKIGDITGHHTASYLTLYENIGASASDFVTLSCAANGASTLATEDAAGFDADFILDIDGDISFDSATGVFIAKKNGAEFSAANSAYAGMILGCTHVFGSGTGGTFVTVSTAWENLLWDTDKYALVTFVVPLQL